MRFHHLVAAALLAAAPAAGCKSESKRPEPATSPAAPAEPAATPATPPAPGSDPAAGEPPASVSPEKKALAEKVLAHMEAIASAGDSNQADCKQAAAAMKQAMDRARADNAALEAMKGEGPDKAARDWFEKAYGNRMMGVMGKVIGVANRCKADPDFQAAMAGSPFAGKKPEPASPPPATPTR